MWDGAGARWVWVGGDGSVGGLVAVGGQLDGTSSASVVEVEPDPKELTFLVRTGSSSPDYFG